MGGYCCGQLGSSPQGTLCLTWGGEASPHPHWLRAVPGSTYSPILPACPSGREMEVFGRQRSCGPVRGLSTEGAGGPWEG